MESGTIENKDFEIEQVLQQLLELGIDLNKDDITELYEVLEDDDTRSLIAHVAQNKSSSIPADKSIYSRYVTGLHANLGQIQTICKDEFENVEAEDEAELKEEIESLREDCDSLNVQKGLLLDQIRTLEKDLSEIKAAYSELELEQEKAKAFKAECMKEVKCIKTEILKVQVKVVCREFLDQNDQTLKQTTIALEYNSESDMLSRTKLVNEFIKKEKEILIKCQEEATRVSNEEQKLFKSARSTGMGPELKLLKRDLVDAAIEELLLELAEEKYESTLKYVRDNIYSDGIIRFNINSYKKIADDEYKRTINDYNSKIQREMDLIRRHFEEKYQKEIDEILERSDRNYFSKKEFKEKIAQLTELAVQQQQRLKKAKECLEKEQEICQKDYDEMFDKAEQLNATFQQLKQLNDNFKEILNRETGGSTVSVRDEYLISLYRLARELIEQLEDADDLQLRDESDLVIMKEDVVNLLRHLVEKQKRAQVEEREKSEQIFDGINSQCREVKQAILNFRSFEKQYSKQGEFLDLQKIWDEKFATLKKTVAAQEGELTSIHHRFSQAVKRRAEDKETGITEQDVFAQYFLEKNPKFLTRLRELENNL